MTTTTITTGGGAATQGNVTAGTFIGRDQIIVLGDYTAEQLETVLTRLREALSHPGAELRADLVQSHLTVTAPDTPPITLSEQAAKDLWPVAARQADDRAYLTALRLDPRYGRWAQQFVALAGILTTRELPPGWADIPPEFTALEAVGEGAQKQIRRVPLADITTDEAIVAYAYEGDEIEPVHGGPVRVVIPHLYFWKSAKWLRGLELRSADAPGFWERNGYHMYGDPFREQRFWGD